MRRLGSIVVRRPALSVVLPPAAAVRGVNVREVGKMLSAWSSFYNMIGSAAAALTGLMFVVITLVNNDNRDAAEDGVSTFSTPTVIHFCGALLTAALMLVPFRSLVPAASILGLIGIVGSYFVVRVAIRTSKITTYRPDAEDWTWHVVLPLVAYLALIAGAIAMHAAPAEALFAPALTVVLLIFIGIHNAWDVVTFLATRKDETQPERGSDTGR